MIRSRKGLFVSTLIAFTAAACLATWVAGQEPTGSDAEPKRPKAAWPQPEEPTPAYLEMQQRAHRSPSGRLEGEPRTVRPAHPAR